MVARGKVSQHVDFNANELAKDIYREVASFLAKGHRANQDNWNSMQGHQSWNYYRDN